MPPCPPLLETCNRGVGDGGAGAGVAAALLTFSILMIQSTGELCFIIVDKDLMQRH